MEQKNEHLALSIVQEYFRLWTNKEFEAAALFLSDSITFEMPINAYNDKHEFMQAVEFTTNAASNIHLLSQLGNNKEAVLIYDITFPSLGDIRIAEYFNVENNKIVFIRHIHDTYEFRKAGFGN